MQQAATEGEVIREDVAADERKRLLRARLRAARRRLSPAERAAASARIARRLDELPELAAARLVLAYAATPDEVDLDPWIRGRLARGAVVALPWVDGEELRVGPVIDFDREMAAGWRGLREPRHDPGAPGLDPSVLEAAVVPGLGFDRAGRRLGQGGGHIDRLLARLAPGIPVVGVAFGTQLLDAMPVEAHDLRVTVVVTEDGVWRADAKMPPLEGG